MAQETATDDQARRGAARAAFTRDLILESLDEAAFLYTQSRYLRGLEGYSWPLVGDFEARLQAHLDALDEPDAFPPLESLEHLDDPGMIYAVLWALCLQGRTEELPGFLAVLELSDPASEQAALDALRDQLPEEGLKAVLSSLWPIHPALACRLVGARRCDFATKDLLSIQEPSAAWAWALGRLQPAGAREALEAALTEAPEEVALQIALALLKGGHEAFLRQPYPENPGWLALVRALRGEEPAFGATPEHLRALGLQGDARNVAPLLEALEQPEAAPVAAEALHVLTGAGLRETAFIPDAPPVGEDGPEESQDSARPPEGDEVERLSQDPSSWRAWWEAHRNEFQSGVRYRLGRPKGAGWLQETLSHPDTSNALRAFTLDELLIAYGVELPFDPDHRIQAQRAALQEASLPSGSSLPRRPTTEPDWITKMMQGQR